MRCTVRTTFPANRWACRWQVIARKTIFRTRCMVCDHLALDMRLISLHCAGRIWRRVNPKLWAAARSCCSMALVTATDETVHRDSRLMSPRRPLRTELPPSHIVRHNLKPHVVDTYCPRRRGVAVHRSQQRRNPFQVDLGAGASHQHAPSGFVVVIDLVDLEGQHRLLHRRLLCATLDAEDDVASGHRVVDRYGKRSELIVVHESPDVYGAKQLEAFFRREVFELALRHNPIVARVHSRRHGRRSHF